MAGKGGGAWKVAYADFVTAMMAFFMVMWLISQSESVKTAVAQHFRNPYGQFAMGDSLIKPQHPQFFKDRRPTLALGQSVKPPDLAKELARHPFTVALHHGDRTMFGTAIYFDNESVELDEEDQKRLQGFASLVRGKPQKVEIRGHAVPGSTTKGGAAAANLWQLSFERCVRTKSFLEQQGILSRQIRLSQAAAGEPYTIGDEPDRLARNSRVEVFMLNEVAEDAVGTREERERRYEPPQQPSSVATTPAPLQAADHAAPTEHAAH